MTPALVRFLKDTEAEVRTAAALKVTELSSRVSMEVVMTHLMPCIRELTNDSVQHVRAALASVIMGMSTHVGKVRVSVSCVCTWPWACLRVLPVCTRRLSPWPPFPLPRESPRKQSPRRFGQIKAPLR